MTPWNDIEGIQAGTEGEEQSLNPVGQQRKRQLFLDFPGLAGLHGITSGQTLTDIWGNSKGLTQDRPLRSTEKVWWLRNG